MNGKLTLTLEKSLIEEAKKLAKSQGKSPSQMVAEFFQNGAKNIELQTIEEAPTVNSLLGIFQEPQPFIKKKTTRKTAPKTEK